MAQDDRTWESNEEKFVKKQGKKLENMAKNKAKKATGKVVVKGLKFVGGLILKVLAVIWPFLVGLLAAILIVVIMYAFVVLLQNVIKDIKEGAVGLASKLFDLDQYDNEKRKAWNYGGDPDYTYILYEKLKDNKDGTQETDTSLTEHLNDLMDTDTFFLANEDLLDILLSCYEYNETMYKISDHTYEYEAWELGANYVKDEYGYDTSTVKNYSWKKNVHETNTDVDNMYGGLTEENLRGEKYNGEHIYTVHWQDVAAMAYMWSTGKMYDPETGWGTSSENEYVPNEGTEYEINSTNGYYFSDEQISYLTQIFQYDFSSAYYYDSVNDNSHRLSGFGFKWPAEGAILPDGSLKSGTYNIGYRYSRIAEPTVANEDGSEITYDSIEDYTGDNPTTTFFAIDSAPDVVYNFMEQYKYAYIATSEVTDYTPDSDKYTPPEGIYCVGKWQITDPRPFINTMAVMYPWFKDKSYNEQYVENYAYNWVDDMMDMYKSYLELLDAALGTDRCSYYRHLQDLYNNETIEVTYYGMKLSDEKMQEFISTLEEKNPGMTIILNFASNVREYGDFYEVSFDDPKSQADSGSIPFPSYGVTYRNSGSPGTVDDKLPDIWEKPGNIPGDYNYTGTIFISMHGNTVVNDWIYLTEGADEPLDGGYSYTTEQIRSMLSHMNSAVKVDTSKYDFTKATQDVAKWQQQTGADVAAILAIILTENTKEIGYETYNWLNYTATKSERESGYYYQRASSNCPYCGKSHKDVENGRYWYNPKKRYEQNLEGYTTVEGACMVDIMQKIYNNYWTGSRHQNTYFRMCFNQYGWNLEGETYFPQNFDEALEQENHMESVGHCYCPWWEDAYAKSHDPAHLWCNKNAGYRAKVRGWAGL